MARQLFAWFILIFQSSLLFCAEENFLLIDGLTSRIICEMGPHVDTRFSPCSTFKVQLSLMGYDAGVLKNENMPVWDYREGYDTFLDSWKAPQTPSSWMQFSCIWYSKLLSIELGLEKIQQYLNSFSYGNRDMSTGLVEPGSTNPAWVRSSLLISPREQVLFLQKMLHSQLPISDHAVAMTKLLIFKEELPGGWQLFGKTGAGMPPSGLQLGWFVGWIEKGSQFFPFAYLIRDQNIDFNKRVPRVKELLSSFLNDSDI